MASFVEIMTTRLPLSKIFVSFSDRLDNGSSVINNKKELFTPNRIASFNVKEDTE